MRRQIIWRGLAMMAIAASPAVGFAQPAAVPGGPARPSVPVRVVVLPPAAVAAPARQVPTFRLFGTHVELSAPVDPPYAGAAYQTFGGQPETSADVISAQGSGPR